MFLATRGNKRNSNSDNDASTANEVPMQPQYQSTANLHATAPNTGESDTYTAMPMGNPTEADGNYVAMGMNAGDASMGVYRGFKSPGSEASDGVYAAPPSDAGASVYTAPVSRNSDMRDHVSDQSYGSLVLK